MAGEHARVPFVGVTGGIGAGKSEALEAFKRLGAATLSSDTVVHELLASAEVRDLLIDHFGRDVAPAGEVDREVLAGMVFDEPASREWLEGQLWPRVGTRIWNWRQDLEQLEPRPVAAIVEVPLLFEAGMERGFDHTLAIVADEQLRAARAGARGHTGLESRTSRQLTQQEKAERAEFVVRNDGELSELERRLSEVLDTVAR